MARATHTPETVLFGAFEFNLETLELRRYDRPLRLQRQPALVLAVLVKSPAKLVTRSDLAQQVWSDVFVDADQGLNNAIRHLRRALGDNADSPVFIETVPKLGYRFVAPVAFSAGVEPLRWNRKFAVAAVLFLAVGATLVVWSMIGNRPSGLSGPENGSSPDTVLAEQAVGSEIREALRRAGALLASAEPQQIEASVKAFKETFRLDPDYAPALLGWAKATWLSAGESRPLRQAALDRIESGLELAPDAPEGHLLRAEIAFYHEWDRDLAERHYARALELGGGLREINTSYGLFSALVGRSRRAQRFAEIALDLDSSAAHAKREAGMIYLRTGDLDRARRYFEEEGIESGGTVECLLEVALARGDIKSAVNLLNDWIKTTSAPESVQDRIESAGSAAVALKRHLRWRLHILFEASRRSFSTEPGASESVSDGDRLEPSPFGEMASPGRMAVAAAQAGEFELALRWLQQAHDARSPSFLRWAKSPAFESLAADPEYALLISDSPLANQEG